MDPGDVCVYREKTPIEGPARGQLPETKTLDFEASRNVGGGGKSAVLYRTSHSVFHRKVQSMLKGKQ